MWKKVLVGVMATMMMGATAMASATPLTLGGSSAVYPLALKLGAAYNYASFNNISFDILYSDSITGIIGTYNGTYDIGEASRDLTTAEVAEGLVATKICQDAVVMIVNPANTAVKNLTPAMIKAIYAGTVNNWKQLRGADAPIVVETYEDGSGTLDFFTKTFMGTSTITMNATVNRGSYAMHDAVAANPNAIGFISMGYVDNRLNGLQLNGVTASVANCENGTYAAVRNFNMVTKGTATGNAQLFLNYVLSSAGQAIVTAYGEVPLQTLNATTSLRAAKSLRATR
jgi:phosphate transport system substrate-binding protein